MMKKALIPGALALAVATLASAQNYKEFLGDKKYYPTPIPYAGKCDQKYCVITVEYTGLEGMSCAKVNPPIAVLFHTASLKYPQVILWQLKAPAEWVFDKGKGIAFKASGTPFTVPKWADPTLFVSEYAGKHNVKGDTFGYGVSLYNTKTKATCVIDPGVVTDW